MTERSAFDPFERRLAGELDRYVAPAVDPTPPSAIAEAAMRPHPRTGRARNVRRSRRLLLFGLAAALLVPAAFIGGGGIRPPSRDPVTQVRPTPTDGPSPTAVSAGSVPILVRRDDGPEPGVSIFAVRADGTEVLVRKVLDSVAGDALGSALPGHDRLSDWGTVSESGWLALSVDSRSWPLILFDLRDDRAEPWVVDEADLGAIGPRWGPSGLIAAFVDWSTLVIADPTTRTTRELPMQGLGLVGGGPSIVWASDGSGIVGATESGTYEVVPLDGSHPRPGVAGVTDRNGYYGPGMATLRVCQPGEGCRGGDDGRIERVEPGRPASTIWQQAGGDRALAASFGSGADEYWLSVDRDGGRQVALAHLQDGRQETVATVNRTADWQYVGAPLEAPDGSSLLVGIDVGAKPAAVLVPLNGAAPTFHSGHFAGFVDGALASAVATGAPGAPAETLPAFGQGYRLPSLAELIAAELRLNPGRQVLGAASRDAVDGQAGRRTFDVPRDQPGGGDAYLDCLGPSSVTVTSGAHSATSPCLRAGTYTFMVAAAGPITVSASGDTSWRVVVYSVP